MSAFHRYSVDLTVAPRARRNRWLAGTALGAAGLVALAAAPAAAGITGGTVVTGSNGPGAASATIAGEGTASVTITQSAAKAVINWSTFSNAQGETVQFNQPNAAAITLNRVTSSENPSVINGSLTANGQVWLLNPFGVAVGPTGSVNVRGFIGTTHNITDTNFMDSNYSFSNAANGGYGSYAEVVNDGMITVGSGYAILAGREVRNGNGTLAGGIFADLGSVVLAGVPTFALALDGDKLLTFAVSGGFNELSGGNALVSNIGNIQARGGRVLMSARAASNIVDSVVNMGGNINAVTARVVGGVINLSATSGTDVAGAVTLDGGVNGVVRINGTQTDPGNGNAVIGGVINVNSNINAAPGSITVLGNEIVIGPTARAKLLASATAGALSTGALANGGRISIGKGLAGTDYAGAPLASRIEIGNPETSNFDGSGQPIVEIQARAFGGTGRQGGDIFLATAPSATIEDPTISTSGFIDVQASSNASNMGGAGGTGGRVEISTPYFKLNPSGAIIANSVTTAANGGGGGTGGTVAIGAQRIETEGLHTPNVDPQLDERYFTRISASGNVQGGKIFLGGGLNGAPAVTGAPMAREIWIGRDTSLRASAADVAPGTTGGTVIVRTATSFASGDPGPMPRIYIDGGISARGGSGGRLETVSHRVQVSGATELSDIDSLLSGIDVGGYAAGGANGTWLIAGRDLSTADSVSYSEGQPWMNDQVPIRIDGRVVAGALNASITTQNMGMLFGAADVRFAEGLNGADTSMGLLVGGAIAIDGNRRSTLELSSETAVSITGNITVSAMSSGRLDLLVKAGHGIAISSESQTPGAIDTNGGNVTLLLGGDPNGPSANGFDEIYNAFNIETDTGNVVIQSEYTDANAPAVTLANDGGIFSNGGQITLLAGNDGAVENNGQIDASADSLGGSIGGIL